MNGHNERGDDVPTVYTLNYPKMSWFWSCFHEFHTSHTGLHYEKYIGINPYCTQTVVSAAMYGDDVISELIV